MQTGKYVKKLNFSKQTQMININFKFDEQTETLTSNIQAS